MAQPDFAYRSSKGPWGTRSPIVYQDPYPSGGSYENVNGSYSNRPQSVQYNGSTSTYNLPGSVSTVTSNHRGRSETAYPNTTQPYDSRPLSMTYSNGGPSQPFGSYKSTSSQNWDHQSRYSPTDSVDDIMASPSLSDYSMGDNSAGTTPPGKHQKTSQGGKGRSHRRPSNRDEFDGPHQFLQRPPPEYIAMQERELPHLPTNLLVQEQDSVLSQVNDRLSQCAYDFVAKYQFPIPLTQDMRPVERPQDREWTEWVYLLKRLATKRRIPARVLYNGQIKQFVTILENSLEMRHAAKHQSRPLKDDRNILQLISAGIQVAKILKDAQAMDYLDRLYVSTELQIHERATAAAARFSRA
ncbi:hypothetical protein VM1G_00866 [Cytospora mali]|uniref:Uncharacterized protein n=1 Tax=Cytospora mali TaxID=578113 RepID=A0A194VMT5_CYTMA|nr:hypothetical protein VM1G_00866 [Valsa mali]